MDRLQGQNQTIVIGGKDYQLAPITLGMLADFSKYFREKPVRDFIVIATETNLPRDIFSEQLKELYREQAQDKRSSDEMLEAYASTQDGVLYFLWLRLRSNGVTLQDVAGMDINDIMAVSELILDTGVDIPEDIQKKILERAAKA